MPEPLFEWAPFRSTKAAIKLHTLLDLPGSLPAFIHISDGKLHDVNALDLLSFEPGTFYVMDRGHLDFERLYALHQVGAFFVTCATRGLDAPIQEPQAGPTVLQVDPRSTFASSALRARPKPAASPESTNQFILFKT